MSISEEAAAARSSLANEKELVRTFEVQPNPPCACWADYLTSHCVLIPKIL
jgi:hypothetical protein